MYTHAHLYTYMFIYVCMKINTYIYIYNIELSHCFYSTGILMILIIQMKIWLMTIIISVFPYFSVLYSKKRNLVVIVCGIPRLTYCSSD